MKKNNTQTSIGRNTGQSGKMQKRKEKDRGEKVPINRQPIQATQNHRTIQGSLKKKPAVSPGTSKLHRIPRQLLRALPIIAAYFLVFIILDIISKQYQELPGIVAWYPPAGLTYALLLVFGMRFVPGVTITLFISSMFVYRFPQPAYLLFLWALIISLIYGTAAAFLRHVIHFDLQFRKLRDVTWFVVTAIVTSALLAVLSVMSSALSGNIAQREILLAIFNWWIGETIGVLTVTPFLLIYVMPGLKRLMEGQPLRIPAQKSFPRPTLAVIGQTLSLVFTLFWVFGGRIPGVYQPLYLITLPLIWIALDHGFKGVTAGIVAMNFGVMSALWLFHSNLANLGELQLLMIVNCMVGLFMGAVVTERKEAEEVIQESEKKFRQLFENSPLGQSMTEINGSISVNNTFCEMLGYTKDELSNKKWQEITPEEDIPDSSKHIQVLLDGKKESVRFEKRYIHKNGRAVWTEINSFLNRDAQGNAIFFITTINNISERKKAEQEIFRLNQELEQRVKDRTFRLEAANQELDAFSYSVSHDLRAPLRAMEGFSEALKMGYPEKLDEPGQHYLTRIQEASLEMGRLIEALLSLSRVTRDELKREAIDLSQMAREITDGLKKQNPKRKVEIEISKNMAAQGDAHLMKVVMENLVTNAWKFTSLRDQAHIMIGTKNETGEKVYYVRDDGVGFDMANASKLFVPFQRLHEKEKFPGSGIGLATVKRIITRHGGRVWAEAAVDQGATFYFTLGAAV